MRNVLAILAASVIALAIAGCTHQVPIRKMEMHDKGMKKSDKMMKKSEMKKSDKMMKKSEMKKSDKMAMMMDAKAIKKVLKSGGNCKWSSGSQKGEDFYYATEKPTMGDADRMMGEKTMQGSWAIKGDMLCLNFGGEKCYGLTSTGKKSFMGKASDGSTVDFKC